MSTAAPAQGPASTTEARQRDLVLVADPCQQPNPRLAAAAVRAGALGVLDISGVDSAGAADLIAELARRVSGDFGIRLPHGTDLAGAGLVLPHELHTVILTGPVPPEPPDSAAWGDRRVLVEVVSRAEAEWAVAAGASGLVAKGCEAGGRIGDIESFVLAQHVAQLDVPFWLQGGLGERTAAAALAAGASGILLDGQLALTRESLLDEEARAAVETIDGSETRVVGGHRVYVRPDLPAAELDADTPTEEVAGLLGTNLRENLLPLGQDAAIASSVARRHVTVGGAVQAVRSTIEEHLASAIEQSPLAPGTGVAVSNGTRYPIAQGPMTRVSDRAGFAAAVAEAGALPFLALALMSGSETRELLAETAERLGDRPWGVGILGFVPADVRAAQLEAIHDARPPIALIAGGRPSQAQPLEEAGIPTYLHVPSPGLLDRFLREGARRFVFEGRECGGHVGPRASLPLWELQVERLLSEDDPESLDVLLAGGIHDARSAAMAAAITAPLAERGARVGVLMGTAYLFTEEAVASGAITPIYQQVAQDCETTVLLETSPGHATRCVETDYVRAFAARKAELEAVGSPAKEMWAELEALNLGRLRVASKGLRRDGDQLVELDEKAQQSEGMYMIGQVASLRGELTTLAELHEDVTAGATEHLQHVAGQQPGPVRVQEPATPVDVAVVGMAAIFPGAGDTEQYWANVVNGVGCVTEVPPDRWDPDIFYDPGAMTRDAGRRTPSKWGGFLPWVPFDALAHGIPPRSLAAIESVQLLSLEVVTRALADAGYDRRPHSRERTSVIFGAEGGNDLSAAYNFRAGLPHFLGPVPPELEDHLPELSEDSFPGVLVNVIAGRIANRLDLGGVNYTVDAACAASLAALDAACKELSDGVSDMVLCGAADVHNGINDYLLFASAHALSPSGRCRTFDASADGIALGEGIACVALKRLADAERDGDRIYAVIEGVAGSSDGRHLGLTAPRKEGQMRAVERAYERAGVEPSTVGLVEAHGTGTVVGDRTELATLTEVFTAGGARPGGAALGSVKQQIGHTKCAAGLAGFIKAVRAVHAGVLPPVYDVETPNGYYEADSSPFRFLDRAQPWPAGERRSGVSAFGFGGTNFHVVLRSHPDDDRPRHGVHVWPAELFLIRAGTDAGAAEQVAELRHVVGQILEDDPSGERHRLRDLARTVSEPGSGPVRWAVVAESLADLVTKLRAIEAGEPARGLFPARASDLGTDPKVAFLHPGQGSQQPNLLADLFVAFPHLQSTLRAGQRWIDHMFPGAAFDDRKRAAQLQAVTDTQVAQPVLGLAGLAMTRLFRDLRVEPDMTAGHSYGELVALATAGVFDEAALLALSEARARAMVDAARRSGDDPGAMAAVSLPVEDLQQRLPENVVLANHNGPSQSVVSGPTATIDALVAELTDRGIGAKRLNVGAAFHSSLVAGASEALAAELEQVEICSPDIPVWSNATANAYPAAEDDLRALVAVQLERPVRFTEQINSMYEAGARIFVEAGPGRVLSQLVDRILGDRPHIAVPCDAPGEPGLRRLLLALAELAAAGVPVDVTPLFEHRADRVALAELPLPAPGWRLNGHLVCARDGTPVTGGLQPASHKPEVTMHQANHDRLPEQLGPEEAVPLVERTNGPAATGRDVEAVRGSHQRASGPAATGRDAAVLEYLRSGTQIADNQRDVMLSYLGSPATPAAGNSMIAPPAAGSSHPSGSEGGNGDAVPRLGLPGNGSDDRHLGHRPDGADPDGPARGNDDRHHGHDDRNRGSRVDMLAAVVEVVAERTGYPLEMLDPDLDLEADLSIDSIKRAEIVGELADRVGLPGGDEAGGLDEAIVEELAGLKTLRAVVTWINDRPSRTGAPSEPSSPAPEPDSQMPASEEPALPATALRYVPELSTLTPALPVRSLGDQVVLLVGDAWAALDDLSGRLEQAGARVDVVPTPRGAPTQALPDDLAGRLAQADAVVHVGAADPEAPVDARDVFAALAPAVTGHPRTLVAATAPPREPSSTMASGVAGLMRTLARELPDRHVRAVELPADCDPQLAGRLLADEVLDPDGPAAVTYRDGARASLQVSEGIPVNGHSEDLPEPSLALDSGSVVVVTGGARGITARAAVALARATGCRLHLLGRSPQPDDEDSRTVAAPDRSGLRRTLGEIGELQTPAEIEAACDRILAAREVRSTLSALDELGSPYAYHQVDVRDSDALVRVLDDVRARHGQIDAVIHGAGVLEDRMARDKTDVSFDRVFGTKVDAARTLLTHLGSDVGLVLFFGSVSGVFGNRGQVDYSAANDALDELARRFDGVEGRRVVSIDWGPWAGTGMVSAEIEREYARRGIGLVDPDEGVRALLVELADESPTPGREPQPAQVVVMRATPAAMAAGETGARPPQPFTAPPSSPSPAREDQGGLTLEALTAHA